jgi:hypothetical protein
MHSFFVGFGHRSFPAVSCVLVVSRWDSCCGAALRIAGIPVLVTLLAGPLPGIWRLAWIGSLAWIGLGSAALAGPPSPESQRAFPILKQIEQQKLDEEFKLLQASRQCVNGAGNLHSLFECHRRERDAKWENREKFHQRIEAVRAEYGLRPLGPPGRNRPRGPEGRPF